MNFIFRSAHKDDLSEMRFIAEADSRIPLEYDPDYTFAESAIDFRLENYKQLAADDYFEVITLEDKIIGFHIVKKVPYPSNSYVGTILSLWVHPDFRGKRLANKLKNRAESWAKMNGMIFMQTNVHKSNLRMLKINQSNGYETTYLNLRKKL